MSHATTTKKNEKKKERSKQRAYIEITNFVDTGVFLIGHSQQQHQQAANILCVFLTFYVR